MLYDESSCSFCGKDQHEVKTLVIGTHSDMAYICDECVAICSSMLHRDVVSTKEEMYLRMENEQVSKAYKDYLMTIRLVTGKKTWSLFDDEEE